MAIEVFVCAPEWIQAGKEAMYCRSDVYRQFIQQYPDAQFTTVHHEDGSVSEIASGKLQGEVVEVFAGTYEADGSFIGETRVLQATLVHPKTLRSDDPMHAYNMGAWFAVSHANSPIRAKI